MKTILFRTPFFYRNFFHTALRRITLVYCDDGPSASYLVIGICTLVFDHGWPRRVTAWGKYGFRSSLTQIPLRL